MHDERMSRSKARESFVMHKRLQCKSLYAIFTFGSNFR